MKCYPGKWQAITYSVSMAFLTGFCAATDCAGHKSSWDKKISFSSSKRSPKEFNGLSSGNWQYQQLYTGVCHMSG